MKKSIRLKNLHDVCIKMFLTGNCKKADREGAREKSIYNDLFRRIIRGEVDIVQPRTMDGTIYTLTRSTRSSGIVKTCFYVKNGEFLALSHDDIDSPEKAEKINLPSGVYDIITL